MIWKFNGAKKHFQENERALSASLLEEFRGIWDKAKAELIDIAQKFQPWLYTQFSQPGIPADNEALQERVKKASDYFFEKINKEFLPAVNGIFIATDNKAVGKKATERLEELKKALFVKKACFAKAKNGFSPKEIVKAVADAEIDFEKKNTKPAKGKASGSFRVPKILRTRSCIWN